jgi:hypothetical protein
VSNFSQTIHYDPYRIISNLDMGLSHYEVYSYIFPFLL